VAHPVGSNIFWRGKHYIRNHNYHALVEVVKIIVFKLNQDFGMLRIIMRVFIYFDNRRQLLQTRVPTPGS
jgi:hypothetical protein